MMIFVLYALLAMCVIFFSARLGYYVDLLDQKTTMASAFIGGVMLAAVTSLPELMTSIASVVMVGKPALVIGNILGSNLFNVAVLGTVFLLYFPKLRKARITNSHLTTATCVCAAFILFLLSLVFETSGFFYGISLLSICILALYFWSVHQMSGDEDTASGSGDTSPLTLWQVILRFLGYSILLLIASVILTYASDYIGETLGMGTTLAGALLLGIVTSLPELISCFVLAKIGNFNAMTGNIVGSNMFNFAILAVVDFIYWNRELYQYDMQGRLLILLGLIANLSIFALLQILISNQKNLPFAQAVGAAFLCSTPILCYAAFIFLSA